MNDSIIYYTLMAVDTFCFQFACWWGCTGTNLAMRLSLLPIKLIMDGFWYS